MKISDILYKNLKIKTDKTHPHVDEMLAVITHWMHNTGRASVSPYGKECRKYLQTILCTLNPAIDKKDITLKSIKEQGLFQDARTVQIYVHRPVCRNGRISVGHAGTWRTMCIFFGMEYICTKNLFC